MKSFLAKLAHVTAIGGQVFVAYGGLIPPHQQGKVAIGLGMAQFVVGQLQLGMNPDGTPATLPFKPPTAPPNIHQ